ncbi:Ammonium transporter Rh type B [Araneus ventricosus]|uniref:Ammonium transporter Rh type B n=1 Tax=Araneus ventricosus TaxID=182803 RepID=A0A4Y2A186_ARAVE|nr:Ammonium transporter Rh type B [Araneus ventricosus]
MSYRRLVMRFRCSAVANDCPKAGLIGGNFASATVLISFGALLGKTSPLQLVIMAILEITIFACNEHLGLHIYKAADIGGSIFLHTFGAYFGLSVTYMLYRKEAAGHTKDGSNYHSDIFAMIGTIFLWMFWPSFNSALGTGDEQHRSVINTFMALLACCTMTFAISSLVDGEGRLNMVHIQNATLAGGVAIGSTSNMNVHPFGAMIIGALAAIISTIGYRVATPYLAKHMKIHDTCGVNNLHGMPGILAGLVSAIVAAMASEENYGYRRYYHASGPCRTLELYSRRKALVNIFWRHPPAHSWYRCEGPGAAICFKGVKKDQTALCRLSSGHLKTLRFSRGEKKFNICTKCNMIEAIPQHLLDCVALVCDDLLKRPDFVLEVMRANDLMDLI